MARLKKHKKEVIMIEEQETEVKVIGTASAELEQMESELDRVRIELEKTRREVKELEDRKKLVPMREIDEDEKAIMERVEKRSQNTKGLRAKIEKQRDYDNQMVTGKFINRRAPGQRAKLSYCKNEGDDPKWIEFEDGKVYKIKRGFAEQINEYYYTPHFIQNDEQMDPNRPASSISNVDTSNKKYAFVSTSF